MHSVYWVSMVCANIDINFNVQLVIDESGVSFVLGKGAS